MQHMSSLSNANVGVATGACLTEVDGTFHNSITKLMSEPVSASMGKSYKVGTNFIGGSIYQLRLSKEV